MWYVLLSLHLSINLVSPGANNGDFLTAILMTSTSTRIEILLSYDVGTGGLSTQNIDTQIDSISTIMQLNDQHTRSEPLVAHGMHRVCRTGTTTEDDE